MVHPPSDSKRKSSPLPANVGEKIRLRRRRQVRELLGKAIVLLALSALGVIFAMPLYWMLATSLKEAAQVFVFPPVWIPNPVVWRNYVQAVTMLPFPTYTLNTLTVCILSMVGQTTASALAGYGFSRIQWPGREVVFVLVLGTMMLPYQVTMIPLYVIFRNLGWINTLKPLIVPNLFGHAFNIFLFRQFFRTIPTELSDAAHIDGCSELDIFGRIILPLSRPVVVTVALFDFLYNWNDFQGPLIYLQDEVKFTLSLGLQAFGGYYQGVLEPSLLMAASTVVVMPAILLFFLAQRTFIQGIALTGLKG